MQLSGLLFSIKHIGNVWSTGKMVTLIQKVLLLEKNVNKSYWVSTIAQLKRHEPGLQRGVGKILLTVEVK